MKPRRVLSFDDAIDELMVLLQIQRPDPKWSTVPLSHFVRTEASFSTRYEALHQAGSVYLDDVTPRVVPAADVSLVRDVVGQDEFALMRFRFLRPDEYRGRVWKQLNYMAEAAFALASVDGRFESTSRIIGSNNAFDWWQVDNRWGLRRFCTAPRRTGEEVFSTDTDSDASFFGATLQGMLCVALTNEYEWAVNIGYGGGATVRVPVSPPAVKDLFRLRDMPEGRSRRAALRHWVSSHWRKKHSDPKAEVEVRRHFRGVERFNWNGLICEVVPSKHDKGRVEAAMEEPPRHRVVEPDGTYRMVDLAIARAAALGAVP